MIRDHILIIGAMKSGTTTLFDQLAADPRIAGAQPKEAGFLAFEEVFAQGWDWYDALHGFEPDTHAYALDGSTDYTKHPFATEVRRRMATAPERRFKLIYVLRDPLDRLESHARHTQLYKMEVGRFVSPRRDHSLDAGISPVNLAVSDYAAQLDQWSEEHARGDLFVTTTERLARDGAGLMAELAGFLSLEGLRWREDAAHANSADAQREENPALVAAARLAPLRAAVKAVLPRAARDAIKRGASRPMVAEGRFRLTPEEKAKLRARYAPMLNRLESEYGVAVPQSWRGGA